MSPERIGKNLTSSNSNSTPISTTAPDFFRETSSQPFPLFEAESPSSQTTTTRTIRGGNSDGDQSPLGGSSYSDADADADDDDDDDDDETNPKNTFLRITSSSSDNIVETEIEVEDDADFQSQYSLGNASLGELQDGDGDGDGDDGEFLDSDDDDEDEGGDDGNSTYQDPNNMNIAMHRPLMQSTGSLHGPNNAFAPPFYNRPPTPLPPSPSLTSLLRPPFSTTTSRPTTPDTSDAETPNDTEAAVAKSARIATTVPRASPKVPTYEYYGFVLYLGSSFAFLIYLLWSYLPSPFLHQLGIYYYPNRWWSLAIPSYIVMTIVYIYVALASYNTGYLTLPMNSIENIVDEAANIAVIDGKGRRRPGGSERMRPGAATSTTSMSTSAQTMAQTRRMLNWRDIWAEGTDAVMDIPVGGVCEILYGGSREEDPELDSARSDHDSTSSWHGLRGRNSMRW